MTFQGFLKSDMTNYPSLIACSLWLSGCNLACPYCHNPILARGADSNARLDDAIDEDDFFSFVLKRKDFIEGVVISGGEATLRKDLSGFLGRVRERTSLKIKLDTNLTQPDALSDLVSRGLVDCVAGDFKVPLAKSGLLLRIGADVGANGGRAGGDESNGGIGDEQEEENRAARIAFAIRRSFAILDESGVEFELRTTCARKLLEEEDFFVMKKEILAGFPHRAVHWFLQRFRNGVTLSEEYASSSSYSDGELESLADALEDARVRVGVR